ncbi:MAG: TonB-dependent receptor [Flavobacteriales bacterium]|nr:TonB-dependent receptor [Flavobacteriales bacterium]
MKRFLFSLLFILISTSAVLGQTFVHGFIADESGIPLSLVHISTDKSNQVHVSDSAGYFRLENISAEGEKIHISRVGFETLITTLKPNDSPIRIRLRKQAISLPETVINSDRFVFIQSESPINMEVIDKKMLEKNQSVSLAEGLSFSTGVRVENNCQSCGFTQVRLNGLDGRYTQILIDGRPIFGQMAGVYALEHIPASSIEQIEIIKGGGSSLFGRNAIAGTVNILTKTPQYNAFEGGTRIRVLEKGIPDVSAFASISRVHPKGNAGFRFSYSGRYREAADINGDDISDIPRLQNHAYFLDLFASKEKRFRFKAKAFHLIENRRGGNEFGQVPHLSDITEALKHHSTGVNLNMEILHSEKQNIQLYAAAVFTRRSSYYGSGGRTAFQYLDSAGIYNTGPKTTTDSLFWNQYQTALNAYGKSSEIPLNAGVQWTSAWHAKCKTLFGGEFQGQFMWDEIPGYSRKIRQETYSGALVGQIQYTPFPFLILSGGIRLDYSTVNAAYRLSEFQGNVSTSAWVPVPRVHVMITPLKNWQIRAGYGRGFRLPQFADEDLHINLAGGNAVFVIPSENLKPEISDAINFHTEYTWTKNKLSLKPGIGAFYNWVSNVFVLSGQESYANNTSVITKRNGSGARVYGLNAELAALYGSWLEVSGGITIQRALYNQEEILWENDETGLIEAPGLTQTTSRNLLRTPSVYGHINCTVKPYKTLEINLSGVLTGSMDVPKISGPYLFPESNSSALADYTEIRRTRSFFDLLAGLSYSILLKKTWKIRFDAGVSNLLNAFQKDLDFGIQRDAGYIYGPMRPRTYFMGITFYR